MAGQGDIERLHELLGQVESGAAVSEDLERIVEVARGILTAREAERRHASVHRGDEGEQLLSWLGRLGQDLGALSVSVAQSGTNVGMVAQTAGDVVGLVDSMGAGSELGSEGLDEVALLRTLVMAQQQALALIVPVMGGDRELAARACGDFRGVADALSRAQRRWELERSAEQALVDCVEQLVRALDGVQTAAVERGEVLARARALLTELLGEARTSSS